MPVNLALIAQLEMQRAALGARPSPGVRRPFGVLDTGALAALHRFAAQLQKSLIAADVAPSRALAPARAEVLTRANSMLGVPYRWGGNGPDGMDCSAFVSRAWGIARHTTDTLPQVADEIGKDELQPGDALNLATGRDPQRSGHVRLFAGWANAERTKMHVYEQTAVPGRAVHHVIAYDPAYTPLRLRTLATQERGPVR